jgi:hypothetical protein
MDNPKSPHSPISRTTSWRASHEYSKPCNIPTPFTIKDILGLGDEDGNAMKKLVKQEEAEDDEVEKEKAVETLQQLIEQEREEEEAEEEAEEGEEDIEEEEEDEVGDVEEGTGSLELGTTPSPQPMELDEPLNLTVVKKRESPDSSGEETNNNRLVNGSGRLFMNNHSTTRDKSPNGPLLPNNVIIPKVKHPKISTAVALKNGTKSKGTEFIIYIFNA